jgi:endonuclease YncB( thermonuclease family)
MKKLILALMLFSGLVYGNDWESAKVKYVIDGDTLMLQQGNKKPFKIRLIALDTFETKFNHRVFIQLEVLKNIHPNNPNYKDKYSHTVKKVIALGFKAKDFVSKRYAGKTVKFHIYGTDKYNRKLVWVQGLNFALIRYGWATYYPNNQISKERKKYMLELSRDANVNHRGIYKRF